MQKYLNDLDKWVSVNETALDNTALDILALLRGYLSLKDTDEESVTYKFGELYLDQLRSDIKRKVIQKVQAEAAKGLLGILSNLGFGV